MTGLTDKVETDEVAEFHVTLAEDFSELVTTMLPNVLDASDDLAIVRILDTALLLLCDVLVTVIVVMVFVIDFGTILIVCVAREDFGGGVEPAAPLQITLFAVTTGVVGRAADV